MSCAGLAVRSPSSADGKTTYEEGKDYLPIRDRQLGQVPYAGEYDFGHAGPLLQLSPSSHIKDGDRLRVSWYHPVLIYGKGTPCCLTEPKVYEVLSDQAKRVNDLLQPKTFFLSHDELRVAGWCRSCEAAGKTPGALLADNVRRCVQILRDINPKVRLVIWSDMFDPHHNAVKHYYLAHGSLEESWKGLPADMMIANWNGGKAAESLRWFADRGHPQSIAGYYDSGTASFKRSAPGGEGSAEGHRLPVHDLGASLRGPGSLRQTDAGQGLSGNQPMTLKVGDHVEDRFVRPDGVPVRLTDFLRPSCCWFFSATWAESPAGRTWARCESATRTSAGATARSSASVSLRRSWSASSCANALSLPGACRPLAPPTRPWTWAAPPGEPCCGPG